EIISGESRESDLISECRRIAQRLLRHPSATQSTASQTTAGSAAGAVRGFISYSWDSEPHKDWVRGFADHLPATGMDRILAQYDMRLGTDRFEFMESSVRNCNVVLCVCTPEYVEKANDRTRGVGVETTLITPQFFDRLKNQKQFIPVIRRSVPSTPTTPDYMSALLFVDFRDDDAFEDRMEELLRHLHKQPKYPK